jgi:xanthine dehydrogenase accessory factor
MALFSGFAVTVCDPREEYRGAFNVPGAQLVSDMPDDVVLAFKPDRRSCVVALTHDPKLDDLALLEALGTEAFYVGAIGSRRNNDARRQRLIEHFGQTEASLARLRGPIGIYVGSKTPPEIAVSVMAEILAVKNGVTLPRDMGVAAAKNQRGVRDNDPGVLVCATRD